jgi:hypothetical protein
VSFRLCVTDPRKRRAQLGGRNVLAHLKQRATPALR